MSIGEANRCRLSCVNDDAGTRRRGGVEVEVGVGEGAEQNEGFWYGELGTERGGSRR